MNKYSYKKENKEKNKIYFAVVVEKDFLLTQLEQEIQKLAKKVKVPGFRPGKAPIEIVRSKLSEEAYINVFNTIIPEITHEILFEETKNGIEFIAGVDYNFNLSDEERQKSDGHVTYGFTAYSLPVVKYDHISGVKFEYKKPTVSEAEVDDVIRSLIRSTLSKEESEKFGDTFEITDEQVAKLGYEESKDVESLRKMVKETLELRKNRDADDKLASDIVSWVINENDFDIPNDLVSREVEKKHEEFRERLKRLNMNEEDFLRTQQKTLEEMHILWRDEVTHNIKSDILLIQIAKMEQLDASDEDVEHELNVIGTDERLRAQYESDHGKNILKYFLTRNNGLKRLIEKSLAKQTLLNEIDK